MKINPLPVPYTLKRQTYTIFGLIIVIDLPNRDGLGGTVVPKLAQDDPIPEGLFQLGGGGQFFINAGLYPSGGRKERL